MFDGVLQLKPQMFTPAFVTSVILPTAQGEPRWISDVVTFGSQLVIGHIAGWNALFAAIQLALGIAFIVNFRLKPTIVASLLWSAIVWVFGEGFGQLFTGQALVLNGAPGAAALYGLVGISIWPRKDSDDAWTGWGPRFAQIALGVILAIGCGLDVQPSYLSANGISQTIAVPWLAHPVHEAGAAASVVLGLLELAVASLYLLGRRLDIAVWATVVLSLACWWFGQAFGQVVDPLSTDVNSGPLMVLLALCAHPRCLEHRGARRWHLRMGHRG